MMIRADEGLTDTRTVREVLRRATVASHEQLHENHLLNQLAQKTISRDDYVELHLRFHAYYTELDGIITSACDRFTDHLNGYAYEPRSPIFSSDLADLAVPVVPPFAFALPLEILPPDIRCVGDLAGAAYVVEGSLLGGSQLCKAASAVLPTDAGCGYWLWCRQNGGRRWAATCRFIECVGRSEAQRAAMVASAEATFGYLGVWLSPRTKIASVHV
ncbi:MAG: biliverdin-producing heme oxygenase [Alphaproteobacteria bacterium]|nr:biliverdin-producing heme oxygenase [Alphaproteobacteria bacterium]